jgi:hypothetical protein
MLNRSQGKDDFVSTVVGLGSSRRPEEQFSGPQIKEKLDPGTTLDAPSRIHNLKHTPLMRRGLVT